jgi:hypothetical protein
MVSFSQFLSLNYINYFVIELLVYAVCLVSSPVDVLPYSNGTTARRFFVAGPVCFPCSQLVWTVNL